MLPLPKVNVVMVLVDVLNPTIAVPRVATVVKEIVTVERDVKVPTVSVVMNKWK